MHGKNSKDEETSQQRGGFALLRTVFCLGSQEMGGLKPGAALALVKAAPVMRGAPWGRVFRASTPGSAASATEWQTWQATQLLQWPSAGWSCASAEGGVPGCVGDCACSKQSAWLAAADDA